MTRATMLILLFLAVHASGAAASQLGYSVYVFGVPVADAVLGMDMASPGYRVALRFHTTGLVDMISGDALDEHSAGRFENEQPAPYEYASIGRVHGRDRSIRMLWHDGVPALTGATPAVPPERETVPPELLGNTINPLDAIVMLVRQVGRTGHCDQSVRAFDGLRLQLLEAHTVGSDDVERSRRSSFAGQALRCQFTDRTLAGYRTGAGREDDMRVHRGTIWLAQVLPGGGMLPVRAAVETRWFGDAMIYLTSASP